MILKFKKYNKLDKKPCVTKDDMENVIDCLQEIFDEFHIPEDTKELEASAFCYYLSNENTIRIINIPGKRILPRLLLLSNYPKNYPLVNNPMKGNDISNTFLSIYNKLLGIKNTIEKRALVKLEISSRDSQSIQIKVLK